MREEGREGGKIVSRRTATMEMNVLLSVTMVPVLIVILNIILFDEAVYYEIFLPGYVAVTLTLIFRSRIFRKPSLTEKGKQFFYSNLFILGLGLSFDLVFLINLTINVFCCSRKVFQSQEYINLR